MFNRRFLPALAVALACQLLAGCGDDAKKQPDATPVGNLPDHKSKGKDGATTRPGPPAPPPIEPIR